MRGKGRGGGGEGERMDDGVHVNMFNFSSTLRGVKGRGEGEG